MHSWPDASPFGTPWSEHVIHPIQANRRIAGAAQHHAFRVGALGQIHMDAAPRMALACERTDGDFAFTRGGHDPSNHGGPRVRALAGDDGERKCHATA
jgi:hypothetical protein